MTIHWTLDWFTVEVMVPSEFVVGYGDASR